MQLLYALVSILSLCLLDTLLLNVHFLRLSLCLKPWLVSSAATLLLGGERPPTGPEALSDGLWMLACFII